MSNIFVFRQPPAGFINEYFGGGKGGSTTTTNNVTQIPPEVLARYNAVNARAETVAQQPYQAYSNDPNAFVAPLSATQQAGIQNTNIMAGAAQPYYGAATEQLMQAQSGAQPGINAAYQNVGQAQNVGNQYANTAAQQYGGAQGTAAPYYQAATQGLAAGLNYANPLNQAAAQAAGGAFGAAAPYYQAATQGTQAALQGAQPYQQAGTQAIAGATGAAQPYQIASTLGLGAALQGAQPFQNAAARGTQNALQAGQPYQSLATQAALVGGQAIDPNQLQTQQYMNPYTQNVVQATQAALNQQQGQQLAQQQADAIKGGAFGGGRAAFQRAQLEGQQSLAQAQAIAPLYQQNYQQALAAAQQQQGVGLGAAQANRAATQQTGQQLAALGQQGFGQNLSAAQQMAALGQQGFNQQTNVAQQMAALGQQNYGQQLGAGQALLGAGQQTYGQQLGAANQMANLGQNLYGQGITGAQTLSQLGQTGYGQQLSASQQAQALGQGLYGQALGTGQAIQGLGQQQYGQGQATAQQLAALAQQGYGMGAGTSAALAGLGTNAQQAGLAGAQAQLAAGQTQQQTQQAGLQALYNQFQQQQGFPYQQAQFLANIAEGTGALSGNATSGTSTTTGGGGFFSDERLKENIQRVGETDDGQPIYRYNYKGDKNTQIGLLAQDVEKHHPEAVGLAGGYKTVNYKKATEDAVHKADGGAAGDAYSMGAPSQMLQENSGKGLGAVPTLPQMITGPQRIEAGANAADVAAMRAPKATGFSLGVPEAKQAELASLQSTLANPGPNANKLGSGPDYLQSRIGTLQDWLSKNAPSGTPYSVASSQGGLVSQPGNFAQGGLAGGYADGGYMNPALQYYAPSKGDMMAMGPYGVAPRQSQQRQLLQGTKFDRPAQQPQRSAIDEATKIGQLGSGASSAWNARPDFLRSAADVAARQQTADAIKAKELLTIEQAKGLGAGTTPAATPTVDGKSAGLDLGSDTRMASNDDFYMPDMAARGGLIGDRHHYSRGGINPYGSPDGSNDILGPIIAEQDVGRRIPNDKGTPAPSPKQQESGGLGDVMKAKSIYDMGDKALKGGQWAAGKLGLGGPETAMSATSTEAIPGVAGGVVPETVAPVVPEAVTAAAPEALAAAAPEAIGAGVAGGAEAAAAAAAAAEAAAAASAADFLPFLLLKRGGVVPRHHFLGGGFESGTTPRSAPFAGDAGGTEMTDEDKANALIKQLAGQTIAEKAPLMERRPVAPVAPVEASAEPVAKPLPARPVVGQTNAGRAPFQHFASKILPEDMGTDTKSALTSENLWVPALAGVGAMLASPNKTLAGAIGSGLVGGTSAYTGLQKQQSETDLARAEERAKLVGAAKASVEYNKEGFPTAVFVSDGMGGMRRMPFIEAYRNRDKLNLLPDVLSEIEGYAQAHPEYVREAGAPKAPAAPAVPVVPAAPAPDAAKPKTLPPAGEKPKTTEAAPVTTEEAAPQQTGAIVTSNEGGDYRYAVEPKKNGAADKYFGSMGAFKGVNLQDPQEVQTIIQSDQNLSERAKNDAKIAEDIRKQIPTINRNMADLHTLSSSINKIGDKGFTQRGAGQESRAALANLYNTTARVMGIPNMQMIDANSDISNTEIINKIQSLSSPEIAKGAGFHAAGIADSIRNAMPGGRLTLEAANTILASMYSEMQKMRDFDKYYDAQTRRYGTGLNAYGNFTNDMAGVYGPEKEAIKKALMAHEVVPKEGEKYRQSYGDVVRKDPRASVQLDKMFKSPGFARYWSDN